uniref:Uncharacterized protein n=1 Tax=Echinococcus canadensis TaxID=519352 RepID=A0A915EVI9_9CEST
MRRTEIPMHSKMRSINFNIATKIQVSGKKILHYEEIKEIKWDIVGFTTNLVNKIYHSKENHLIIEHEVTMKADNITNSVVQ